MLREEIDLARRLKAPDAHPAADARIGFEAPLPYSFVLVSMAERGLNARGPARSVAGLSGAVSPRDGPT